MSTLNSSCISGFTYNSGTLSITFRNGRTYTLRNVPWDVYLGFLSASSLGRYFNTHLKGRY